MVRPCDGGGERTIAARRKNESRERREEGKVICHNDREGGGGGGGQTSGGAAFEWTKVNEIIFVSSGLEHTHDGDDDERRTEQRWVSEGVE